LINEDRAISSKMKKNNELTSNDLLKYEIAEELGFMDKVNKYGWKSLTAKESGKIGGIMTKKKRETKNNNS
jgi:small acid-soluble spore protein F (minor alpha/beta-type SASP)